MTREEWLKERQFGIGASDAAAVLDISPWKTSLQLWQEKTGKRRAEDIGDKPYVRYGNEAEMYLRALFAMDHSQYHVSFEPYKILRNPEYPFIFATPDGELEELNVGRKGGLEIKTTEIVRSGQMGEWKDRIPDTYYIQCLHQMLAAGWEFVKLKAQLKISAGNELRIDTRHYTIERADCKTDMEYLMEAEIKFWNLVQRREEPPLKIRL